MKLTVVGCGDAFGSGGRLQTCYHVETSQTRFVIDCGATTLIGFNKLGIDPNTVETIFISHLHGDHFAGLVWWLVHAQHVAKRTSPSPVVGPEGVRARFEAAAEALFPGSTGIQRRYDLRYLEMTREKPMDVGSVRVTPFEVKHPCGAPPYALRFETRRQGAELQRRHGVDRHARSNRTRGRSLHHGMLPLRRMRRAST